MKNFMSVGNVTQAVEFKNGELFLVLGENMDLGGNDNRNGCGKTTIVNALCYVLYGKPLGDSIKLGNLINKTNAKGMLCTIQFESNGKTYRIERGRGPNIFKFYIDDEEQVEDEDSEGNNESRGENKNTQQQITKIIGMEYELFRNIVAMTTQTDPFLKMRVSNQREIIETLLGVTQLSEKAHRLYEVKKQTKDDLRVEEINIEGLKQVNNSISENIKLLETKLVRWESAKQAKIKELESALVSMDSVDVDAEIAAHKFNSEQASIANQIQQEDTNRQSIERQISRVEREVAKYEKEIEKFNHSELCPTCKQEIDTDTKEELKAKAITALEKAAEEYNNLLPKLKECEDNIAKIAAYFDSDTTETFYGSLEEALNHKNKLSAIAERLEEEITSTDPFSEQIEQFKSEGLKDIDYTTINNIIKKLDHEEYLYKLLNNRDSFIRKKIINQNLHFLNSRLKHYLDALGLPHSVMFQSDLTVEIQEHGRDLDFDNLSRGEKTRLSLGLSFAFRDVYEHLNAPINLLFIDELLDNGLDVNGVESSVKCLKQMVRANNKSVFLVSHRDELTGRTNNIIRVVKENGYTTIESNSVED